LPHYPFAPLGQAEKLPAQDVVVHTLSTLCPIDFELRLTFKPS
jgi:hypothetical protein